MRSLEKGQIFNGFIETGARINARYHIDNVLEGLVKDEGTRIYSDGNWTFIQDFAPVNKANIIQAW